ncbi:HlyD family secretion protein [Singulisphaera sp. GP187]|uniref:HlyD family secretion protein n=1 Tax=Singulisphaera sp. GP187 TaxID=1882752 RepID=UPI000926368C|nr:HlyD family efflux transporter periplasmic adaptor subunit [Singulisphaera sp. GP187]SIO60446.1 HlyD family secretion protein [Singulisphaera sp. GP187]
MSGKIVRRIAWVGLVAVVAFFGWQVWKARQAPALPAGIVSGNGRIESIQVDITAKYPGRLVQLLAREGDLVKPGQVLARMDTLELEAQLARAKAQVAEAEDSVATAKSDILQRESNLKLAEQKYARGQVLLNRRTISREEWDQLRAERDASKAAVESENSRLRAAMHSVEAALAEVNRFQVQIADSTLKSPVQGRVLYRLAEEGEVLAAGGKALTLINLSDIYMEIFLPSRVAALVEIGADARIVLDAMPQYAGRARVSFVSPETQFTPKQVETPSERDKLMFRVKLQVPSELILPYIEKVKTGVRGVGYVRLDNSVPWPAALEKRFPKPTEIAKPDVAPKPSDASKPEATSQPGDTPQPGPAQ